VELGPITRRGFLVQAALAALTPRLGFSLTQPGPLRVRTTRGWLSGEALEDGVRVFRGIPFAQPPVGPLRFRPPQPVQSWQGERQATVFAPAAMQSGRTAPQSEDCLYLNLWTPAGKGPFPVFVWIHGGGFLGGRSSEPVLDGAAMARAGIVCITVAYRLGVLGFMDMEPLLGPSYAGSANLALRDLMAALEWVRDNAADFGGDPGQVTIGGESAGAKLTGLLMGVPAARPLFQQMISQSGGAERIWPREHSRAIAASFQEELHKHSIEDARTAPAAELIAAQQEFLARWPEHFPLRAEIDGALIPRLPVETIAAGSTRGKRLLLGTMRDESAMFIGPHPKHDPVAGDLGNMTQPRFAELAAHYRTLYPELNDEELRIRALTAEEYWIPSMRLAEAHEKGGGHSWVYRVDFAESSGFYRGYAYHSLDVPLVWDHPSGTVANAADEAALAHQMNHAWQSFLRGAAPTAPGLPPWPAYERQTRPTMIFDHGSHVEEKPHEAELQLWKNVL
jgi:para-nitrobenzyl esterase